ncbi:MAG: NAD(P)/FAD-dependent oxidoreductase [Ktedonobacteraceae bacterium]
MTTTENNTSNSRITEIENGQTKQPTTVQPRVVIVGSGFGGLLAARALRDAPVQVTVIDKSNHHLFQPLLYQVATAGLSPADISAPIRSILKKQANTRVLMAEVTGIDTQEQRVMAGELSVPYDYLIVATGACHSYFGHDEWEQYAPGLKSITDATAIRRDILLAFEAAERETDPEKRDALLTFVLVGAGPTGVEMAGAIGELAHKALVADFRNINPKSARIILVEAGPTILPVFPESQSRRAQKALNRLGVEVRTSAAVENITRDGVFIAGKLLPAKTVIWTAGVAASAAGQWLGADVDRAGRVKVTDNLALPNQPNVFVVGDTACVMQDGKLLPGVAPVAMQEGRYVASVIAQKVVGKDDVSQFHYHDKGSLATVGRSFGIVDIGRFRFSGFFAWVMWLFIHIFYLIGFRNRFVVMFQWAWAYLTFQRGARLITFDTNPNQPV